MQLSQPPIQSNIVQASGLAHPIWVRWFSSIFNNSVVTPGAADIEVTDSTKGVILTSPDSNRWRVTVSNAGALVVTLL